MLAYTATSLLCVPTDQVDVENRSVIAVQVHVHGAMLGRQADGAVLQCECGAGSSVLSKTQEMVAFHIKKCIARMPCRRLCQHFFYERVINETESTKASLSAVDVKVQLQEFTHFQIILIRGQLIWIFLGRRWFQHLAEKIIP